MVEVRARVRIRVRTAEGVNPSTTGQLLRNMNTRSYLRMYLSFIVKGKLNCNRGWIDSFLCTNVLGICLRNMSTRSGIRWTRSEKVSTHSRSLFNEGLPILVEVRVRVSPHPTTTN